MTRPSTDSITRREYYTTLAAIFLALAVLPATVEREWFTYVFEIVLALAAIWYTYKAVMARAQPSA